MLLRKWKYEPPLFIVLYLQMKILNPIEFFLLYEKNISYDNFSFVKVRRKPVFTAVLKDKIYKLPKASFTTSDCMTLSVWLWHMRLSCMRSSDNMTLDFCQSPANIGCWTFLFQLRWCSIFTITYRKMTSVLS